jgi:hypothetical protein
LNASGGALAGMRIPFYLGLGGVMGMFLKKYSKQQQQQKKKKNPQPKYNTRKWKAVA